MNIDLPFIFYDLETTALDTSTARITQIAAVKIWPGDNIQELLELMQHYINTNENVAIDDRIICTTINPEMPVSRKILEMTHLTQETLNNSATFAEWAPWLKNFFTNTNNYPKLIIGGYNTNRYDNYVLESNFKRAGVEFSLESNLWVDPQQIFNRKEPRTLAGALQFYCGKEIDGAHNALVDIKATVQVFLAQMDKYPDISDDMAELDIYCRGENSIDRQGKFKIEEGEVIITFGKHAGMSLRLMAETQPGMLKWILGNDFPPDVKQICDNALKGIFPEVNR